MSKPPLYADLLNSALLGHARLPLRSESHPEALDDLFIDVGQLAELASPDWQVVFGRRGTGKTHIFRVLEERMGPTLLDSDILAVRVDANDCLVSSPGLQVSDAVRARAYFEVFIEALGDRLFTAIDALLGTPSIVDRVIGTRRRKTETIERLALEVNELTSVGVPIGALSTVSEHVERDDSSTSSRKRSIGFSVDSSLAVPVGASAKASAEFVGSEMANRSVMFDGQPVQIHSLIRAKIIELLDELGLDHLQILIDEWVTLDNSASTAIQPEFAELLKRTFGNTPRFSVCIATNRFQTKFSNKRATGGYRGLELGADIFEALNLDRSVGGEGDVTEFFKRLLFTRLKFCEPRLAVFDPNETGIPDDEFFRSLFRDADRAFDELVHGSQGNPRDFIIAFRTLSSRHRHSLTEPWSTFELHETLRSASAAAVADIDYHSPATDLLALLRMHVVTFNTDTFTVFKEDERALAPGINELLEKRLIREVTDRHQRGTPPGAYRAYVIGYGFWLDASPLNLGKVRPRRPPMRMLDPQEARRLAITGEAFASRARETRECFQCQARFSLQAREYQVRRLCPECLFPADQPQGGA